MIFKLQDILKSIRIIFINYIRYFFYKTENMIYPNSLNMLYYRKSLQYVSFDTDLLSILLYCNSLFLRSPSLFPPCKNSCFIPQIFFFQKLTTYLSLFLNIKIGKVIEEHIDNAVHVRAFSLFFSRIWMIYIQRFKQET